MRLNKIILLVILLIPFISFAVQYSGYAIDTYVGSGSDVFLSIMISSDNLDQLKDKMTDNLVFEISGDYRNYFQSYTKTELLTFLQNHTNDFNLVYNSDTMVSYLGIEDYESPVIFNESSDTISLFYQVYDYSHYKINFISSLFTEYNINFYDNISTSYRKSLLSYNNVFCFDVTSEKICLVINYPQTISNLKNSGLLQNTEFIKNNAALIAQILKYNLPVIAQNTTSITNLLSDQIGYVQTIYEDMFMHLNALQSIAKNTSASTNLLKSIDNITKLIQSEQIENTGYNRISSQYLSTISSQYDLEAYANGTKDFDLSNNYPLDENNPLKILHNYYRISKGLSPAYNIYPNGAWNEMRLDKIYGSYSSNTQNKKTKQLIGTQALNAQKQFQQKVGSLSQMLDEDGNVTDPDTGEKVPFIRAAQQWTPEKANNAFASYSYNLPSATNGFFGQVKRTLTEASDWFLLDKGTKEDTKGFQDNVLKKLSTDGVKVDDSTPIQVQISQKEGTPFAIEFPSEFTHNHTLRTSNESLDKLLQAFESWNGSWLTFTGLDEGIAKDKGWLQLQYFQNGDYYSYMTNDFSFSVSNQLDRIISNTSLTNTGQIVSVEPTRGFYPYLINFVSTLGDPDDTGFWIDHDHVYEPFSGQTNYNQAVINLLQDNFAAAANNVKANQMSFEWIRGIFYAMHMNSNMLDQVHYITNNVFSRCGLSLDPNHSYEEEYNSYKETMQADFDSINNTISEWQQQGKEKIESITTLLFGKYLLPSKVTLFEFNGQKFTADLKKMETPIKLMHYGTTVSWLAVGLIMLPRIVYMLLNFLLRLMSKFLKLLESSSS